MAMRCLRSFPLPKKMTAATIRATAPRTNTPTSVGLACFIAPPRGTPPASRRAAPGNRAPWDSRRISPARPGRRALPAGAPLRRGRSCGRRCCKGSPSSCVTSTTVIPRPSRNVSTSSSRRRELSGSSPAEGSSRKRTAGSSASARASAARLRIPPLRLAGYRSSSPASPTRASLKRASSGRAIAVE